jgi:hypothetical protein
MTKFLIHILIFILSIILIVFYFFNSSNQWKTYQKKWKKEKLEMLYSQYNKTKNKKILDEIKIVKDFKIRKIGIYVSKWKREEYCTTCHIGIKDISKSHPSNVFGCVVCHGGDPLSVDIKKAHKGLVGNSNPSDLKYADISCGKQAPDGTKCHGGDIKNIKTSLMYSMAGVIADLRYQWNTQESKRAIYATHYIKDNYGRVLKTIPFYQKKDVPPNYKGDFEISGKVADSHFRKFCSMCHIGVKNINSTSNHSSGCAACHIVYEDSSSYLGEDPTIPKDERGHPPYHVMTSKIPTKQCLHCHNRSNRYGTSYTGIAENDFYGVPYDNGTLSKNRLIGGRFYYHLKADIHFQKGMDCIDCHTKNGIMGDGKIYDKMDEAVKIKCEDCHGAFNKKPGIVEVNSISDKLLSTYDNINLGDKLIKGSSGEIFSNVKHMDNKTFLFTKISGKKLPVSVIYRDKKHKLNNCNKNMECYTCHFSWTMNCYGCHIGYNDKYPQRDFLTNFKSSGHWYEARSYTRYNDVVLGINKKGKISPMQFCQSQITFSEKNYYNKVFIHKDNTTSYVVAPVQPHTVTKMSKKCSDCHNNPMAVGLGRGYLKFTDNETIIFKPIYNMKKAKLPVDFAFESVVSSDGKIQYQSVSNIGFKVFKRKEILKILRVGRCTPCHNSYSDKIYNNNNFSYYYNLIKKDKFNHIYKIQSSILKVKF